MKTNVYVYIFIMFAVTYLIRVLPLTLIRKPIKNRFIRSFLFYVPYVTLAVMTFPDIVNATSTPVSGLLALLCGADIVTRIAAAQLVPQVHPADKFGEAGILFFCRILWLVCRGHIRHLLSFFDE